MTAVSENYHTSCLEEPRVRQKIRGLESDLQRFWQGSSLSLKRGAPGRDAPIFTSGTFEKRKGLSERGAQARLLHNLANIELQAMELAFRTYAEYPTAPQAFREQLGALALSESRHLELCLDQLEELGFEWGTWPVHLNLWAAVSEEDTLLDRLVIVHRYLEACGLDSSSALQRRLVQSQAPHVEKAVKVIAEEEVGHVAFGSYWYHEICTLEGLDPNEDFPSRLRRLGARLPKRIEELNVELRRSAGFLDQEIAASESLRQLFLRGSWTERPVSDASLGGAEGRR